MILPFAYTSDPANVAKQIEQICKESGATPTLDLLAWAVAVYVADFREVLRFEVGDLEAFESAIRAHLELVVHADQGRAANDASSSDTGNVSSPSDARDARRSRG